MNIIDFPTKRVLPVRKRPIVSNLLHTTGGTDLDQILAFYTDPNGFQPHYFIEIIGTIRRLVPEDHVAYHCAMTPAEAAIYGAGYAHWTQMKWQNNAAVNAGGFYSGYDTWSKTWHTRGLQSPLELVTGSSPNGSSIGIELQQPTDDMLTPDIFLDAQYEALAELVKDINARHNIPADRAHQLGHYDVNPLRRSTSHGGYDPGEKFNWSRFLGSLT